MDKGKYQEEPSLYGPLHFIAHMLSVREAEAMNRVSIPWSHHTQDLKQFYISLALQLIQAWEEGEKTALRNLNQQQ